MTAVGMIQSPSEHLPQWVHYTVTYWKAWLQVYDLNVFFKSNPNQGEGKGINMGAWNQRWKVGNGGCGGVVMDISFGTL